MNIIILCDKKPNNCKQCMFFQERIEQTAKENTFELCEKCILGAENIDNCPMTEIHTVFSDDEKLLNSGDAK